MTTARLLAGVPDANRTLYWRIRFACHDPASIIDLPSGRSILILRDVELARARHQARADEAHPYEAFAPDSGLSGDREIRAAQATAECLVRLGIAAVHTDRSIPLLYADELRACGIAVECDRQMGILERRRKSDEEVEHLRRAQTATEEAIEWACRTVALCNAMPTGDLEDPTAPGDALTADRLRDRIESRLAQRGFAAEGSIVAPGPIGADCHDRGHGPLRTAQPIIIDVFPKDRSTGYHGDCTRMVVHGDIPDAVAAMHAAVARAKAAAIAATCAGVTGEAVHRAVIAVIESAGYRMGFPPEGAPDGFCSMPHGTGHGLGLDLKEPPLLDLAGPELIEGDAVTIEPGLYMLGVGGMRLEDLVIVRKGGCDNLNTLHEGLDWR